jgi:hypothetical protein
MPGRIVPSFLLIPLLAPSRSIKTLHEATIGGLSAPLNFVENDSAVSFKAPFSFLLGGSQNYPMVDLVSDRRSNPRVSSYTSSKCDPRDPRNGFVWFFRGEMIHTVSSKLHCNPPLLGVS